MRSIKARRWRRRRETIVTAVLLVLLVPVIVLLLPILLPVALAAEARAMRRLAETPCVGCGTPIGLDEIRRARAEAQEKGGAIAQSILASGGRPRVAVDWDVICPTCGQAYVYPEYNARRPALVPR